MLSLVFLVLAVEADYNNYFCKGVIEYRLEDMTRVDCLDTYHAIEYDWAHKWYEAVGQSLYYAMHTGRKAGIVLIIKEDKDFKHVDRAYRAILHYDLPITLWTVREGTEAPILYLK